MPRKPKYTREEVINSAFEVTGRFGMEAVTAASVAANMGYTGSSLFTHFSNMEELKQEVYSLTKNRFLDMVQESLSYEPAFKELGMRWIRFAKEEPNLYRILFSGSPYAGSDIISEEFSSILQPMKEEVQRNFEISEADAQILMDVCITQANGIAGFIMNGYEKEYPEKEISSRLGYICLGMVIFLKGRSHTLTPELAEHYASGAHMIPIHK